MEIDKLRYFPLPLLVKFIDGETWELTAPFEYITKEGETIRVPVGFLSDFASIPRFFWRMIGTPTGRYGPSAIIHDYLYYAKPYTRTKADKIFYEAMGILGVPNWKRSMMHFAVRIVGWIPWKKRKPFVSPHIILLIILLFGMSGISCASLKLSYDKEGKIEEVWSTGIQDTEITQEQGDIKTTIKRKAAFEIWPENLFSIYKD